MSLPTLKRDYARWRSLHQLVDIVVDAYEFATDRIIATHFKGDPDGFAAAINDGLKAVPAPTTAHLRELIELIGDTSISKFTLSYEDRDFLTRVRSHLCDALERCMRGDVEGVAKATDDAYKQLDFITYGRKRTDKRDFHNPFTAERERFVKLTARAAKLARALDREAVSI